MSKLPVKILLIEDDEEDYIITREHLSDIPGNKYHLDWASSFEEGLKAIEQENYDIFLIDYRLGKMEGLALIEEIPPAKKSTPFILLTEQGDLELDQKAMEAGASEFLNKTNLTGGLLDRAIRYSIQHAKTLTELKQRKERAQTYLDMAGSIILILNADETIQLVNQEGVRILGYSEEEIIGKNWFDNFIPEKSRKKVREIFYNLVHRKIENVEYFENEVQSRDGKIHLIRWYNRLIFDEEGESIATISSGIDVTALKKTQLTLLEKSQTLSSSLELVKIGTWQLILSTNTIFLDDQAKIIFDISPDKEFVNYDEFLSLFRSEDQKDVIEKLGSAITNKSSCRKDCLITVSGNIERWVTSEAKALLGEDGEVIKLIGISLDITERKENELKILKSEAKARILFEHSAVIIWEEDFSSVKSFFNELKKKGTTDYRTYLTDNSEEVKRLAALVKVTQVNQQSLAFYGVKTKDELVTSLPEWFIDESWIVFREELIALAEGQTEFEGEIPVKTPKGELKYLFVKLSVPPQYVGTLQTVLVSFIDITAQKESKRKIQEYSNELAQKVEERTKELSESEQKLKVALAKEQELGELKSRFVAMASHEFRTPLSAILSSTGLIGRYAKSEEQGKRERHIKRIKSSVQNLTGILNDFLSLEKLESNMVIYDPIPIDLGEFLQEILEEINLLTEESQNICLLQSGTSTARTDPHLLRNILNNLLSNALKYSPKGEDVDLMIENSNNMLTIQVKDRGIGIPEEDQKHMFTRFFRATNATNIKGTGLGLTIVKRYLHLMKGDISFTSKSNEGTTFTVKLPQ